MRVRRRVLIKQTVSTSQSVGAQLPLEIINPALVGGGPFCARQNSHQNASSFNRRSPSIHCSGTEKFPPPSRYFAAKPHPRKIVTRAEWSFCSRAQAARFSQFYHMRPCAGIFAVPVNT